MGKLLSRPKILYITPSDLIGGVERCVVNATREFKAKNWEVETVFKQTEKSRSLVQWCLDQGVKAETSPALLGYDEPHNITNLFKLRKFIRSKKAALIHLHYGANYLSFKDILAVRLAGFQPCIVSIHNAVPWTKQNEDQRRKTQLAAPFCNALIVHSEATRNVLIDAGIAPAKIHFIHYGLYPPSKQPSKQEARLRLGIDENIFVITTYGRLVPHKGAADLIEAVAQMPDKDNKLVLLIAGQGPERENFEKLAAIRAPGKVRFLGQVDQHADLYAASDVFSMPSHDARESFGMVFIEAAFHAVPSVGTRIGGIPEAVLDGVTGLLVEPYAPAKLAAVFQQLREDTNYRERLGKAARARAYSEFTADMMANSYEQVYHQSLPHLRNF